MKPHKWAAFGAAALALAACSSRSNDAGGPVKVPPTVSAAKLAKVTLRIGDQKAGSEALLKAAGQLKGIPYKLSWSTFTSGPPELEAISDGAVDVGAVGNTPPIFAAASGAKIMVVAASQDHAQGDTILVPKGSPIHGVADLKGKTIAVAKGSSAHGNLLLQLKKVGLTPQDVKTTFLQPSDAYAAFTQGRVDAWAVWDPYTAQAQVESGARILASGRGVANGAGFIVAGRSALADPARDTAIRDLVIRLAKSRQWAQTHAREWARVYSKETGLPMKVALLSSRRSDDRPVTLSPSLIKSEQSLTDLFYKAKVTPADPKFSRFVDHRFDRVVQSLL